MLLLSAPSLMVASTGNEVGQTRGGCKCTVDMHMCSYLVNTCVRVCEERGQVQSYKLCRRDMQHARMSVEFEL